MNLQLYNDLGYFATLSDYFFLEFRANASIVNYSNAYADLKNQIQFTNSA